MNSRHRKTLLSLWRSPTPVNIAWADIEGLLVAVGCEAVEGPGSAVSFRFDAKVEFFHRPHPQKEAKRYQVKAAKAFLEAIGVKP